MLGAGRELCLLFVVTVVVVAVAMVASIKSCACLPADINPSVASDSSCTAEDALIIDSGYNFTGGVSKPVIVTADNIVIDGKGYRLTGCGFNLTGRTDVTVRNVVVEGWMMAFLLNNSRNNTITNNTVKNNSH